MALNFLNDGYFAGKVGIGTESPSRNLQVKGTANTAIAITAPTTGLAQLALGDTDDDNYAQILLDNSTNKLQIQNGGGGVVSNRGITLDSSENVGIGTDSPSRPLHVNGGGINFVAEFQSTDDKASILIQDDDTLNYIHSQDGYLSLGGQSLLSASNLNINSSSGNVGIGTPGPSEKLHVNAGASNTVALFESTDAVAKIFVKDNSTSNNYSVGIGAEGNDLTFHAASGGTERMRITSAGNVGIGTTSPGSKLTVFGDIMLRNPNGANPTDAGSFIFNESGTTWGTDIYGFRFNLNGSSNVLPSTLISAVLDILCSGFLCGALFSERI